MFPQKTCHQRNLRQTKYLLFNFWMIKYTVIPKKAIWQFGKIGVLVNFIIQKLKSKHLVCLSFLWWQVFLREREKIFYTYSGPNSYYENWMPTMFNFYLWTMLIGKHCRHSIFILYFTGASGPCLNLHQQFSWQK